MEICLVVIFNHRFDSVLNKLRELYSNRFTNIKFLVPFYDGIDKDVIPVFESSYQFQGYFIQALPNFYEEKYDYYFFVSDDMIICPHLNEKNLISELNLKEGENFITNISPLNSSGRINWIHSRYAYRPFSSHAVNFKNEIPEYGEALKKMKNFFGDFSEKYDDDFFLYDGKIDEESKSLFIQNNNGDGIKYPLAGGYSDTFIIHKSSIRSFSRLCGVFSAMNLFVEIAIPTAIILTSHRIKQIKDTKYQTDLLWNEDRVSRWEEEYNCDLSKLIENYDDNIFCKHPIKLSHWK